MSNSIAVAVIGAGAIGRTHLDTIRATPGVHIAAVVDPTAHARALAGDLGASYFSDTESLIRAGVADAAIVATPNELHLPVTEALLTAGLPVLLEKPVAESLVSALKLVAIADRTGVPLLVGHHRRHNPVVRAARAAIKAGEIGDLMIATVTSSLAKPAAYFEAEWRRRPGVGGPLLINLVHEIDLLRYFFGEIATLQSITSNRKRGFAVEDTAAVCLTFAEGGMATLCISDAAVGPWAWDLTANENSARFPAYDVPAHYYAGSRAGLSLPDLQLWKPQGTPDWTETLTSHRLPYTPADTYVAQLQHFAKLVRNGGDPLVSVRDATANIVVLDAIAQAGVSGQSVAIDLSPLTLSQGAELEGRGIHEQRPRKSLAIVELLADHPTGLPVSIIAAHTDQPASGVHRTLQELARLGYVRQLHVQGDYVLTIRMPAMGLGFLGRAGITDVAQPVLDSLAALSGELIRLSVVDGDQLIWVAVAQGATRGLRYDPGQEQGVVVHLASSSGGKAWLSTMTDDEALGRVSKQGLIRDAEGAGPNAPQSLTLLLQQLDEARKLGYAVAVDSYIAGMAAMALPVRYRVNGPVLGCLSIAGPAVRMTAQRMAELALHLKAAADELGNAAVGSKYFETNIRALEPPI